MNVIYFLIPVAIIFVICAIALFFWAVKSDQFQDLDKHGHSILFDDEEKKSNENASITGSNQENEPE
ncbi:cbb3-type cytochrome oxidase assembly protein CcoS [Algicola sagamiensis]|uniref:cbb3-type cytochrome oxidase assembly protein CcoS n=1 Tax=Algicola sagamiensis TaxID=163869 RepID=UPI0003712FA6|nr:cbb3-type cytochrome oxidase assembly protein CcoS [Algicola sagamiensis]